MPPQDHTPNDSGDSGDHGDTDDPGYSDDLGDPGDSGDSGNLGGAARPDDEDGAPISRRNLIRLLVVVGLGIPIAVEARTLIGLIDQQFFGGERHENPDNDTRDTVGVGDEFLPETEATERITKMVVNAGDAGWTFHFEATVENTTGRPYELRLGTVHTTDGTGTGGTTTGTLNPGETTDLTAEWSIPEGSKPTAIETTAITDPEGDAETIETRIELGNVPVDRQS